jgi:hypothetical protein
MLHMGIFKIAAGEQWKTSIGKAIDEAIVAVLLVSPNFLESDFIAQNELPPLLNAARTRGLRILWLPVSASSYEVTQIADFQAAINPASPLDTLSESQLSQVLVGVCRLIKTSL